VWLTNRTVTCIEIIIYREHDIDFLSRTYADLEAVNRELENERERHKVCNVIYA